jgi:hypothetical protein
MTPEKAIHHEGREGARRKPEIKRRSSTCAVLAETDPVIALTSSITFVLFVFFVVQPTSLG